VNLEVNGIDLHWEESGDGEPLLWLHGALGCGDDWQYIFSGPPEGYRIIAPDLRGHGTSTNPGGAFTFRQCALDVQALLQHLRIPRVKAIGLSGGGIVLLHMATSAPASVESMVLVSAPPYFPECARAIQRQFSPAMLGPEDVARMRARHTRGEAQLDRLFAIVRGFATSYDDVNFTPPYLGTITARTLIVFGDRDPFYPVSIACELHAAIPESRLWVIPDGGHSPVFLDAAPPFRATAMAFLNGTLPAGQGRSG
jgi:pimeloyl-ACP methyl ester carboxylesterase